MTDEIVYLLEKLQILHSQYQNGDYVNFFAKYQFEIYYWFQFQRLAHLIEEQINEVKPFQIQEN